MLDRSFVRIVDREVLQLAILVTRSTLRELEDDFDLYLDAGEGLAVGEPVTSKVVGGRLWI